MTVQLSKLVYQIMFVFPVSKNSINSINVAVAGSVIM